MAKSKVRKKNNKKNTRISYVDKIISNIKNKSKTLKVNFENDKSIKQSLDIYIDHFFKVLYLS